MKTLKESLLDDIDNQIEDQTALYIDWIEEHYKVDGKLNFHNGVVDVDGNLYLKQKSTELTNGQFKFGKVTGCFDCGGCANLKTLDGAPKEVGNWVNYNCCKNLKTLKGGPKKVGGNFECSYCHKLVTLEGGPEEIGDRFFCTNCKNLKTLKGAPKKTQAIYCSNCPKLIVDLNDIPYIKPNKIRK